MHEDDSGEHTILLDTEGLGHTGADANHDIPIFTLAVLLSSTFVFNNKGAISESTLDSLSVIAKLAQRVTVRAGQTSTDTELSSVFPVFISVLRDFHLRMEHEGRAISSDEYLDNALEEIDRGNSGRNAVRKVMQNAFRTRRCFALPFPGATQIENLQLEDCAPGFRDEMERLTDFLTTSTPIKSFGDRTVTGPVLHGLLHAWVEAINDNAVPNIMTALEHVIGAIHERVLTAAHSQYDSMMANVDVTTISDQDLRSYHQRAVEAALHTIHVSSSGDRVEDAALETTLQTACNTKLNALLEQLAEHSLERCSELIPESILSDESEWVQFSQAYPCQDHSAVKSLVDAVLRYRREANTLDTYHNDQMARQGEMDAKSEHLKQRLDELTFELDAEKRKRTSQADGQLEKLKELLQQERRAREAAESQLREALERKAMVPCSYAEMDANELRGLLTERGLNCFGPKHTLVARLYEHDGGRK